MLSTAQKIREILCEWDPIGIGTTCGKGALYDEYEGYVGELLFLIKKRSNSKEIRKKLLDILEYIGLSESADLNCLDGIVSALDKLKNEEQCTRIVTSK